MNKKIKPEDDIEPSIEWEPLPFLEINDILKVPLRFNIMFLLYNYNHLGFTRLQTFLKSTAGNLDYHLKILKKAGWIIDKVHFSPRPLKFFFITSLGDKGFGQYISRLQDILNSVKKRP